MTISMSIDTHDIRLESRDGMHLGTCSCGWISHPGTSRSIAAAAAVKHGNGCAGTATMGARSDAAQASR
jgi:hypothetical protein